MLSLSSCRSCCVLAAALPRRCRHVAGRLTCFAVSAPGRLEASRSGGSEATQSSAAVHAPLLPPRQRGVSEGEWDRADVAAVREALVDAEQPVASSSGRCEGGLQNNACTSLGLAIAVFQPSSRLGKGAARGAGNVLLGCSTEELEALAVSCGQPAYRGRQLLDCLLQGAHSTADLRLVSSRPAQGPQRSSNCCACVAPHGKGAAAPGEPGRAGGALAQVPRTLREELASRGWRTGRAREHARVAAADGTLKLLLQLADGRLVEAVGIPERDVTPTGDAGRNRLTACVSSQARIGRHVHRGCFGLGARLRCSDLETVQHSLAGGKRCLELLGAGGLPNAVHVLRHRQGRLCAQPART